MSYFEREILHYAHPKQTILRMVGAIWALYFLWLHNWVGVLAVIVAGEILGRILSRGMNEEGMAQTIWGKIMLIHLHPVNLLIQIVGGIVLVYGVWIHSGIWIMVAMSVVLIGHMWGWHKVSEVL
ncbi:MAG TPA: hypothetical protein VGR72_00905 [Candidatus Acidoferrales bacterium]|nr:hypothetical protein [Candidatus Acidoferrales bacterium]